VDGSHLTTMPVVLFVGNYGSGKTEVSVNFAIHTAHTGVRTRIADLDLVNPYFRSREVRDVLEEQGVGVVLPPEEFMNADLPVLTPKVRGLIQRPDGVAILDVGGDDVGATVLASLAPAFQEGSYEVLQVLNHKRPFTDTLEGVLRIQREIETASRLPIAGYVSNSHLMDETEPETVYEGLALALEVSGATGKPVRFITALASVVKELDRERLGGIPVLPMERLLLPPWRRRTNAGCQAFSLQGKL